jgi:hypothetical protein
MDSRIFIKQYFSLTHTEQQGCCVAIFQTERLLIMATLILITLKTGEKGDWYESGKTAKGRCRKSKAFC